MTPPPLPSPSAITRDSKALDAPFWRVLAFVFTGLVGVAVWVLRTNVERIDKINENQIEMKTLMRVLTEQSVKTEGQVDMLRRDLEALRLSDRSQQEQLSTLTGGRTR